MKKDKIIKAVALLIGVVLSGSLAFNSFAEENSVSEGSVSEASVSETSVSDSVTTEDTEEIPEEVFIEDTTFADSLPDTLTLDEIKAMDLKGKTAEEVLDAYLRCDPETVTFIDLSNHSVGNVDLLKSKIAQFEYVTQIDMCDCGLDNETMDEINKSFENIKVVWMIRINRWKCRTDAVAFSTFQGHNITYKMTNKDAEQFKYCTDMVAFDIGHNRVSDVSFLQYMPNLKILILVDNSPLSDISVLEYCPKIEYLEFFVDKVSDLSVFEKLPELRDVNIGYNPISDVTYLLNIPKLERLWIECTRLTKADYQLLQETYPDAKIVYYGSGSVDQGWRSTQRYWGMRYMFKNNKMDPEYMDPEERAVYEAEKAKQEARDAARAFGVSCVDMMAKIDLKAAIVEIKEEPEESETGAPDSSVSEGAVTDN